MIVAIGLNQPSLAERAAEMN